MASKPGIKFLRNTLIPMSDGVRLAADLWMPDIEGHFPCILTYLPYRKDDFAGARIMETLPFFFAEKGYCYAFVDIRGTGSSEGVCTEMYSRQEQRDGYEVVEWLASQRWSNGSVGMLGWSYGFSSTVLVAAQNPPHLKAIVPFYGNVDLYDAMWEGGSFVGFQFAGYLGSIMAVMNSMPPTHRDPEGRWIEMWRKRIEKNTPWVFGYVEHQTNDDYWMEKSISTSYGEVKAPTLAISGWNDIYPSWPALFYAKIDCPKKLIMGPWIHQEPNKSRVGPRLDYYEMVLRFFDHWLKGEQNGVMEEPPVLLYTATYTPTEVLRSQDNAWMNGSWRRHREWPMKTQQMQLYLHKDRLLTPEGPGSDDGFHPFEYDPTRGTCSGVIGGVYTQVALPIDQRGDEVNSLVYSTAPLEEQMEVTGQPSVILDVASSADVAALSAKLCDEAPDGSTILVSRYYLNLTRRNSRVEPSPLRPHQVYTVQMDLNLISYLFQRGHRMKLIISGADFPHLWPTPRPCSTEVHYGKEHPSRLILPVVAPGQGEPVELPSPEPASQSRERLLHPDAWKITRDMTKSSVEVTWVREAEIHPSQDTVLYQKWHVTETTNKNSPADTRLEGMHQIRIGKLGSVVDSRSRVLIQSDDNFFHVSVELETEHDGVPHTRTARIEIYPRKLC